MESSGNQWFATLSFHNKHAKHKTPVKCQLDIGATCNVLSYRALSIIAQDGNPPTETKQSLSCLMDPMMKPLGVVDLKLTYGGQTQYSSFK